MKSDWRVLPVDQVCELIVDCVNKTAPVVDKQTDYRMIRTTHVRNGRIDLSDCKFVIQETYEKWTRRAQLENGDVVLTREAPIGEVGFVQESNGVFLGQRLMQYRANKTLMEPRFLLYSFLSPALQHQFGSHEGSGSVVSHIRVADCFKFELAVPPLEEQRAIAETLGALDDRIDNLRQTNAILQAIAAALFKSWFIDFDGVAPEDLQESELGLIPKGWRVVSFDEIIEIISGGTPKTSVPEYWDGEIPWFSVVDAPDIGQTFVLDTEKKITSFGLSKCSAKLLPEMTTIITARGTVGKVALTGKEMAMNQSCYGLRSNHPDGEAFVYFSTLRLVDHLQRIAHGAVFDTITRDSFKRVKFCLPPDGAIAEFGKIAMPILHRIRTNGLQAVTLAHLRDTLLPRLISGKLRIFEAVQEIAEVAN